MLSRRNVRATENIDQAGLAQVGKVWNILGEGMLGRVSWHMWSLRGMVSRPGAWRECVRVRGEVCGGGVGGWGGDWLVAIGTMCSLCYL